MKRLLIYFLVLMVIFSLWTLISQREARQKALAHTGAGYFQVNLTPNQVRLAKQSFLLFEFSILRLNHALVGCERLP